MSAPAWLLVDLPPLIVTMMCLRLRIGTAQVIVNEWVMVPARRVNIAIQVTFAIPEGHASAVLSFEREFEPGERVRLRIGLPKINRRFQAGRIGHVESRGTREGWAVLATNSIRAWTM